MTYNKARVFTLRTLRGQRFDMTLYAADHTQYDEWVEAFAQFKKDLE